jgi:hypothetical protein
MNGRVVDAIALVNGQWGDGAKGSAWAITADPDVVIRLKRILPAIRTTRAQTLIVSDTEQVGRELEWVLSRPFAGVVSVSRWGWRWGGHCTCRKGMFRRRLLRSVAVLDALTHAARSACEPAVPLVDDSPRWPYRGESS